MTCIIGLTGSVATGKSTAASLLRHLGVPVFDADACVHQLLKTDRTVISQIQKQFPTAIEDGRISRKTLGQLVFSNKAAQKQLEAIMHPVVREREHAFIRSAKLHKRRVAVLDIPLLFETGADDLCDRIWLTTCPVFLQWQRALKREGMSIQKLEAIIASQWPQEAKLKRADAALFSGLGKSVMMRQIKTHLKEAACAK